MSSKQPPMTWNEMDVRRPAPDAAPGTILNLPRGRVLVRSYDTTNSTSSLVTGDPDGDYQFDDTSIPVLETESTPRVGDTVFYVGEVSGDDAVNVWCPMRVVWVGPEHNGYVRVRSLCDKELSDAYIGEQAVPLHLLTKLQRDAVKDLAMSLKPANAAQAATLLAIFTCDWMLDRDKADG
jgi:hypothetical protein